jgi:hypothetical protein
LRREIQQKLDNERSARERNRLGQFETPIELARGIATTAIELLQGQAIRFLEPSIGSGAFFSALLSERAEAPIAAAHGFEIDPRFAEAASRLWLDTPLKITQGDFTKCHPLNREQLANLVLANPPYVRHHHLGKPAKDLLRKAVWERLGQNVSGLAGLYVYFILLADQWMADGGIAAWLVPTEWMDVNYGSVLKHYLTSEVTLDRIHRFEAVDVQFGDALVSSSVIFFRKMRPVPGALCDMTVGSLLRPSRTRKIASSELGQARKWSPYFLEPAGDRRVNYPSVTLGDLFTVKRGVVTGGNDFFIRPRAEFINLGIPEKFLRPVLPSSRYLNSDTIDRRADGYPDIPEQLALLDCDIQESAVRQAYPELWAYLESPRGRDVRQGYLTSRRHPWYAQEKRPPALIIVTYMGRGRKGGRPFRFFWNRSDATATNVYLLLIPRIEVSGYLRRHPEKAKLVVEVLTNTDLSELLGHGRVYGGGLYKLEPKELERLDATRLVEALGLAPMPAPLTD